MSIGLLLQQLANVKQKDVALKFAVASTVTKLASYSKSTNVAI